jgi:hypothetical protein
MKKALIAMCGVLLLTTACGNSGDNAQTEPTDTATASATPVATPCVLEGADLAPKEVSTTEPVALLTDVRPNADGCPRVVLEFKDHVPAYKVEYVDPPISDCGSGENAPIDEWGADAFLSVRMEPASSADMTDENAALTYDGPRDFDVNGTVLRHLKKTCDFEAVMVWVIALDAKHPFKVDTFEDPARLVVDISGS